MKATELIIGDWVNVGGNPYQVYMLFNTGENGDKYIVGYQLVKEEILSINNVYDDVPIEDCHPIPLTTEILEKNGFVFNSCGRRYWYEGFGLALDYGARSKELYLRLFRINRHVHIHYVHQLQHALRLCGLNDLADNFKVE